MHASLQNPALSWLQTAAQLSSRPPLPKAQEGSSLASLVHNNGHQAGAPQSAAPGGAAHLQGDLQEAQQPDSTQQGAAGLQGGAVQGGAEPQRQGSEDSLGESMPSRSPSPGRGQAAVHSTAAPGSSTPALQQPQGIAQHPAAAGTQLQQGQVPLLPPLQAPQQPALAARQAAVQLTMPVGQPSAVPPRMVRGGPVPGAYVDGRWAPQPGQHVVQRPGCSPSELLAGACMELQGCCERVSRVAVQIFIHSKSRNIFCRAGWCCHHSFSCLCCTCRQVTTGSGELPAHISYSILPERPSTTKRKADAQRGPGFKRQADTGSPLQVCAQPFAPHFHFCQAVSA